MFVCITQFSSEEKLSKHQRLEDTSDTSETDTTLKVHTYTHALTPFSSLSSCVVVQYTHLNPYGLDNSIIISPSIISVVQMHLIEYTQASMSLSSYLV